MQRLRRIAEELRAVTLREAVRQVQRGYRENDLLTFANAVAFQVLFAIIPLGLFGRLRRARRWVGFGSIVVVVARAGTSLVLGWYVTSIADFGSIFGVLSTVVVAPGYL